MGKPVRGVAPQLCDRLPTQPAVRVPRDVERVYRFHHRRTARKGTELSVDWSQEGFEILRRLLQRNERFRTCGSEFSPIESASMRSLPRLLRLFRGVILRCLLLLLDWEASSPTQLSEESTLAA